jgi:hypothetical protein
LEAYKNSSSPLKTPAEAAKLVATALSRIQRADLEVNLFFPLFLLRNINRDRTGIMH